MEESSRLIQYYSPYFEHLFKTIAYLCQSAWGHAPSSVLQSEFDAENVYQLIGDVSFIHRVQSGTLFRLFHKTVSAIQLRVELGELELPPEKYEECVDDAIYEVFLDRVGWGKLEAIASDIDGEVEEATARIFETWGPDDCLCESIESLEFDLKGKSIRKAVESEILALL